MNVPIIPTLIDTPRNWRACKGSLDGTKLIAADHGGFLYTSTNSGITWTARMTDIVRKWWVLASSSDGIYIHQQIQV